MVCFLRSTLRSRQRDNCPAMYNDIPLTYRDWHCRDWKGRQQRKTKTKTKTPTQTENPFETSLHTSLSILLFFLPRLEDISINAIEKWVGRIEKKSWDSNKRVKIHFEYAFCTFQSFYHGIYRNNLVCFSFLHVMFVRFQCWAKNIHRFANNALELLLQTIFEYIGLILNY